MKISTLVLVLYALFCLVGGVMGYVKADSIPSLIAGVVSFAVVIPCALAMQRGSKIGAGIALFVALFLGVRFLAGYIHNMKVMPHLVMVILSSLAAFVSLFMLYSTRKAKSEPKG